MVKLKFFVSLVPSRDETWDEKSSVQRVETCERVAGFVSKRSSEAKHCHVQVDMHIINVFLYLL